MVYMLNSECVLSFFWMKGMSYLVVGMIIYSLHTKKNVTDIFGCIYK
jgi:hypothetical protein